MLQVCISFFISVKCILPNFTHLVRGLPAPYREGELLSLKRHDFQLTAPPLSSTWARPRYQVFRLWTSNRKVSFSNPVLLHGRKIVPPPAPAPFVLVDLTLQSPQGKLSLICGRLGSGKTLLLLALLGEADILSGQMLCPRSPPNSLAGFTDVRPSKEEWVVQGMCAYMPQAAWLQNASIRDNILFSLPYDEKQYKLTLEVNLSGGQKARVSLARAVYSQASILLLDDVLSTVDAHTAHHLYHNCLRGELMQGRTVILVSHHVQLCAPGAAYVVTLDNGRALFQGGRDEFQSSGVMSGLVQSTTAKEEEQTETAVEDVLPAIQQNGDGSESQAPPPPAKEKNSPRKLIEEEARAIGRVAKDVWLTYFKACGGYGYWALFLTIFVVAALGPVLENGWVSYWSRGDEAHGAVYIRETSLWQFARITRNFSRIWSNSGKLPQLPALSQLPFLQESLVNPGGFGGIIEHYPGISSISPPVSLRYSHISRKQFGKWYKINLQLQLPSRWFRLALHLALQRSPFASVEPNLSV
ncbi:P-loop containing nucleoside triphosphate hydrolase protein [Mycena sanguinolenta]|nr:P-loop containing nucleoside triphosphate hydrolase protein [Mycena sanguinolenta]